MTGEQLQFDFAVKSLLADQLADRRHDVPAGGAERLLKALIREGLDRDALPHAAALALELERAATSAREEDAA
jgi:hypothetical protein